MSPGLRSLLGLEKRKEGREEQDGGREEESRQDAMRARARQLV